MKGGREGSSFHRLQESAAFKAKKSRPLKALGARPDSGEKQILQTKKINKKITQFFQAQDLLSQDLGLLGDLNLIYIYIFFSSDRSLCIARCWQMTQARIDLFVYLFLITKQA